MQNKLNQRLTIVVEARVIYLQCILVNIAIVFLSFPSYSP